MERVEWMLGKRNAVKISVNQVTLKRIWWYRDISQNHASSKFGRSCGIPIKETYQSTKVQNYNLLNSCSVPSLWALCRSFIFTNATQTVRQKIKLCTYWHKLKTCNTTEVFGKFVALRKKKEFAWQRVIRPRVGREGIESMCWESSYETWWYLGSFSLSMQPFTTFLFKRIPLYTGLSRAILDCFLAARVYSSTD